MQPLSTASPRLPSGYRLLRLESTDSTNAEGLRRAKAGEAGPLWIWSLRQSAGRGRQGRDWQSQSGNLFASLLITVSCPLAIASQLALVAGIAAHDATAKLIQRQAPKDMLQDELMLKWPNDVLLGRRKLGGILIETASAAAENRHSIVIGTGLNLRHCPEGLPLPATSLASHGIDASTGEALEALADETDEWLRRWDDGASFQAIRKAWMDRASKLGERLTVKLPTGAIEGGFAGIDAAGALKLKLDGGEERRIAAGDVFFPSA